MTSKPKVTWAYGHSAVDTNRDLRSPSFRHTPIAQRSLNLSVGAHFSARTDPARAEHHAQPLMAFHCNGPNPAIRSVMTNAPMSALGNRSSTASLVTLTEVVGIAKTELRAYAWPGPVQSRDCRFLFMRILASTSVKGGVRDISIPKHSTVQYGNCGATCTPVSPPDYGNIAPQRPCAPEIQSVAARRPPGPALRSSRRHAKPAALGLLPRPTEVQPRAYMCICMYTHGHGPTGSGYGRAAPAAAYAALEPPPGPPAPCTCARARGSRKETGLGRRPGSGSGYCAWNSVQLD